jgi:hypothetical protein
MKIDSAGSVTMPKQPSFSVGFSGAPTINSGTTMIFDTINHNTSSGYNSSNGRFTAPVYGVYQFSYYNNITGITSWAGVNVIKNGSHQFRSYDGAGGSWINVAATFQLLLNAGDYVNLTAGGSGSQRYDSNSYGRFSGFLIG